MFFSQSILANNVPNTGELYRTDTRPPSEIFSQGFSSLGNNDSVRDHSRGASCIGGNQNSGFISMSTDPEYAANYARRLYAQRGTPVYVYIMDSNNNFYNMRDSLYVAGYTAGIRDAEAQSEWIALHAIPNTSIQGVRAYTGAGTPAITPNPHYANQVREINRNPYRSLNENNLSGMASVFVSINPPVTACMAATLSCLGSKDTEQDAYQSCGIAEPYEKRTILYYSTFLN
jgi:pertussis toxin subunit 1